MIIEKGPICVNGISLTVFDVKKKIFRIAIIAYTFQYTNIKEVQIGDAVNPDSDVVGKYINRKTTF